MTYPFAGVSHGVDLEPRRVDEHLLADVALPVLDLADAGLPVRLQAVALVEFPATQLTLENWLQRFYFRMKIPFHNLNTILQLRQKNITSSQLLSFRA